MIEGLRRYSTEKHTIPNTKLKKRGYELNLWIVHLFTLKKKHYIAVQYTVPFHLLEIQCTIDLIVRKRRGGATKMARKKNGVALTKTSWIQRPEKEQIRDCPARWTSTTVSKPFWRVFDLLSSQGRKPESLKEEVCSSVKGNVKLAALGLDLREPFTGATMERKLMIRCPCREAQQFPRFPPPYEDREVFTINTDRRVVLHHKYEIKN